MKYKKTTNQIFDFATVYYIVLEQGDSVNTLVKKFGFVAEEFGDGFAAVTISHFDENNFYVVFAADKDNLVNLQYISHEVFHLVYHILEHAGVELSPSSQETFAYMIGHYNNHIVDWLNKQNIGIKIT